MFSFQLLELKILWTIDSGKISPPAGVRSILEHRGTDGPGKAGKL
jgi:hypothetical protein